MAAICHDLGMIHIPAEIVMKVEPLTATEYGIIQTHAEIGSAMLSNVEFAWPISQIVVQHHERYDGTGYPGKLAGESISIEARIIAVADAFASMTSSRPYRPALSHQAALQEIREGRGTFFDPTAADACVAAYAERRFAIGS
jgi:HD-GYP domain-containing protein (c-di-GMP phosphodiesterase class II)